MRKKMEIKLKNYWNENIKDNLRLVKENNLNEKVFGTMFELKLKDFQNEPNLRRYKQLSKLLKYYIESEHFDKDNAHCYINRKPRGVGMQLSVYYHKGEQIYLSMFYSIIKNEVVLDEKLENYN